MGGQCELTAALGAIEAIDPAALPVDLARAGDALCAYVEGLGLSAPAVRWVADLRVLREERVWPAKGAGRWPTFAGRQASLLGTAWRERELGAVSPRAARLAGADGVVLAAVLGTSRYLRAVRRVVPQLVRVASAMSGERAWTAPRAAALVPLAEAARLGLFAFAVGRSRELVCVSRPRLRLDDAGRLHDWDGHPAAAWEGGRSLWFWRGVQMSPSVGRQPDRVTAAQIASWANAERRRVAIERLGLDAFVRGLGGEVVQHDDYGRLWRTTTAVAGEPYAAVEVTNATAEPDGSHRRYFLRVPPDTRTARAAVAWTFGYANPQHYLVGAAS
jgi:hypothetical protein